MTKETEKIWMDALAKRGPPMSELGPAVVGQTLRLVETAQERLPNVANSLLENGELEAQSLDHIQKRSFYKSELNEILEVLPPAQGLGQLSLEDYNRWVKAGYTCVPWFVQELEGTLRRTLRLVLYLKAVGAGVTTPWKEYQRRVKYLPEAVSGILKNFQQREPLYLLVAPLEKGDRIRLLRNATAHNDWSIFHAGERVPRIAFFDANRPKVFTMPLPHVLKFFDLILEVNLVLGVALHLGYSRLRGEEPFNPTTDTGVIPENPKFWDGLLIPGTKRMAMNALLIAESIVRFAGSDIDKASRERIELSQRRVKDAIASGNSMQLGEALCELQEFLQPHFDKFLPMALSTEPPWQFRQGDEEM